MKRNELEKANIRILCAVLLVVDEEDRQTQKLVQFCVCHQVDPEEQYCARPFHYQCK